MNAFRIPGNGNVFTKCEDENVRVFFYENIIVWNDDHWRRQSKSIFIALDYPPVISIEGSWKKKNPLDWVIKLHTGKIWTHQIHFSSRSCTFHDIWKKSDCFLKKKLFWGPSIKMGRLKRGRRYRKTQKIQNIIVIFNIILLFNPDTWEGGSGYLEF